VFSRMPLGISKSLMNNKRKHYGSRSQQRLEPSNKESDNSLICMIKMTTYQVNYFSDALKKPSTRLHRKNQ